MLTLTKAVTYADLNATFRKGLRNGNWRKRKFLDEEHTIYVVNPVWMVRLKSLYLRLLDSLKRGRK
uniref:Uncharacterized protein n=1 Tax=Candidatus Methanophagaceae archaeon ANME-1 ERB6 TaxID=2759912 RepID=A0A7G9YUS4_9EURY|nr:hypothetical protein LBHPMFOL_00028 [Methanosarcinales archaeon ANME-1 ERB6]